jgi:flavin reductase (DIM6/NTAB) family NADH-FMN oxidoreductase RutF
MSIGTDEFRAALGRFASGITVVTTKDANGRFFGITVSAFCSVSLEPRLILVCIDKNTGSHHALEETHAFVVNILRDDQGHLSDRFAAFLPDKFDAVKFRLGLNGLPILEDVLANLECRLVNSYDGGDHTIFVGEVAEATINDGKPLLHWRGDYREIQDKN